ncbi:flagellar protein FlgN [Ferrimonas pelagia]|uniref:Flagella synthesis protein FlgN n=1 Tax=Ferrimonas pelagia TaxID=1177826 RepID=A0ABP9F1G4_9GAMM
MSQPHIADLLSQQLTRLGQLLALLEQETDALVNREVEQIETLLKRKLAMLDEVALADGNLARHPDLAQLSADPELQQQTTQAKALLAQCKQRNLHNQQQAELASASLARLQQVLLSTTRHSKSMTYNDSGQTHVGSRLGKSIKA